MKKSLISLAVVAGMAASGAALAEATVYGNVHISINDSDSDTNGMDMTSNTSHIGFKAAEDVGDGMKVFAKIEFQPDTVDGGALGYRDAFVGVKGGMGTAKFGQFSSNYKQMGGKVDPMYRTRLEGRGALLGTQSSQYHGGRGVARGRMTDQLQLTSSKMGGIQAVINRTFDDSARETLGFGVRYEGKGFMAYIDTIKSAPGGSIAHRATKFGGSFKTGALKLGLQIESANKATGFDHTFVSANYSLNKNDSVAFTYGMADGSGSQVGNDRTGMALMYKHKMSKMTNVYAGYGDRSSDKANDDDSMLTFGIQKKF